MTDDDAPILPLAEHDIGRPVHDEQADRLLEITDLVAGYVPGVDILRGCSMHVNRGELVGIIGPNGAGKSTLIKAVFGLVTVRSGSMVLDGEDIVGRPGHELVAHGVGYVPPGRRVFGSLTVEENLAVGAYGKPKDFSALYARFPLLAERRRQRADTLSGGEQQLLVIARALAGRPELLVLEDPCAGLAPPAIEAVAQAIAGLTVLIADESLALARRAADRIVLIEHDAIVLDAPREVALADERLGRAYVA